MLILQKVKGWWENQLKKGVRSRLNDKGGIVNRNTYINLGVVNSLENTVISKDTSWPLVLKITECSGNSRCYQLQSNL